MTDRNLNANAAPTCPQCGAPVPLPDYADIAVCAFCGSTLAREQVHQLEEQRQQLERQTLRSVQCSQCAGPLSAREGKRVLVCDHCGVRIAVMGLGGLSHWYFPSRVDRTEAFEAGVSWLGEYPGIAPQVRAARLAEAKLVYVPIWEHKVLAAGWEFGSTHRSRIVAAHNPMTGETDETMELQLLHEGVQEPRLHERRFYLPATDFEVLGARRPRVTGRELLVPLLAGEIEPEAIVLEAEGEASEVVERGRAAAQMPMTGALNTELHMFLFRETVSLLYYPLWLLRFQQGDSYCRVVVDGRDGTVNSGLAPADQRRSFATLTAKIGAQVVLGAVLLYLGVTLGAGRTILAGAAVVVSAIAVWTGVRYRPEKEVDYHDPFSC
jgi:ribosomal protein L37AE/L43A